MQTIALGMALGKIPWGKVIAMAPQVTNEALNLYERVMHLKGTREAEGEESADLQQQVEELGRLIDDQARIIAQMSQIQSALLRSIKVLGAVAVIAVGFAIAALTLTLLS